MNEYSKIKKFISTQSGSIKRKTRKNALWKTVYSEVQQNNKFFENWYKTEIQRIKKDIEEGSLKNWEITQKYLGQEYSEELKLRVREARFEPSGFSFLHLAAINCRGIFIQFLVDHVKIDKNILCKGNLNGLHLLIRSNVFLKQDLYSEKYQLFKETFEFLIKNECDYNSQDELGFTPLHYAAIKNNLCAALLLLDLPNIAIDIEDKKNLTPLHIACKHGNEEMAELLIEKIDPLSLYNLMIYDYSSTLPLHLVCRHKNEKILTFKAILDKLHTLNSSHYINQALKKEDANRQTILHLAIENNHVRIVELILMGYNKEKELTDGNRGILPIHVAAKNGSIEMLGLMQRYGAVSFKQNYQSENAMHIAAGYNRYRFLREFINYEKVLGAMDAEERRQLVATDHEMTCICVCEEDGEWERDYLSCLRAKDCKSFTPLMTALASLNQKCVEVFLTNTDQESLEHILNEKDGNGNSIFHICAEYNNTESLKYLFQKFYSHEMAFSKNNAEETILHCALRNGNLEMVKLILNKLYEYNTIQTENLIFTKNKHGQTCFHIAAQKGYFNICEYFLKEKKLVLFVELFDNNSNSALHLATLNGHSSIVSLLCEHGADSKKKNDEHVTPFEISCRKGYFEISKILIENYDPRENLSNSEDYPLHTACYEGAHEVVRVLLQKGAIIDQLNSDNKNCLDIAIARGHREVIRVLLNDQKWKRLIRINNYDVEENENESPGTVDHLTLNRSAAIDVKPDILPDKVIECPQLCALFDIKMWDSFKIILDKCVLSENEFDFTMIDPPIKSMSSHPLMLIARSGQESLLRHQATLLLLHLKWRFIPRFAFYFNLTFYLFFMLLFSVYSVNLSQFGALNMYNKSNSTNDIHVDHSLTNNVRHSSLFFFLMIFLTMQLIRELFQLVFLDGISYFTSYQNLIEILTYVTSMVSLVSTNYSIQSAYGSVAVLCAFLLFPLYIQKLKIFGLYVVAFQRTLKNSSKFLPIFLIMFTGFILSFNIRHHFGVRYFNTTDYSVIRALTMVVGELETNKMGLLHSQDSMITLPNYLIYSLFIGLMCIIMLNLFVGIAVGEIKTVLDEADIQQTSLRIMFVLKVQSAVNSIQKNMLIPKRFHRFISMNYTLYSYESENKVIKFFSSIQSNYTKMFSSTEQQIILSDPQKRLEESFSEMARFTNDQIKSIKFGFSNQMSDVESKLFNSQRRLQDFLHEFANMTNEQIEQVKQDASHLNAAIKGELKNAHSLIDAKISDNDKRTSGSFKDMNKFLIQHLAGVESRLTAEQHRLHSRSNEIAAKTTFQLESVKECSIVQANNLKAMFGRVQERNDEAYKQLESVFRHDLQQMDTRIVVLLADLSRVFMDKLEESKRTSEGIVRSESNQVKAMVSENRGELIRSFKQSTDYFESYVTEMSQDLKSNSDFEFKSFKLKANCLEEKMNIIELQLDNVQEAMTKLSTAIASFQHIHS